MPLFESACQRHECPMLGHTVEHFYPFTDSLMCTCESCGSATVKQISTFNSPFMGVITERYKDRSVAGGHGDGHWAWNRKTPDGKPRAEFIETFQQQAAFCKREGLARPQELPKHAEVSADGKSISTRGMPGQEI